MKKKSRQNGLDRFGGEFTFVRPINGLSNKTVSCNNPLKFEKLKHKQPTEPDYRTSHYLVIDHSNNMCYHKCEVLI